MQARRQPSASPKTLRARAERRLRQKRRALAQMPAEDVQKLVHELQTHQIELEMQNDELRRAQLELQQARDRYADLFDFAPVTHLTMSADGEILEANLNAAKLLGLERERLTHQKFTRFVPAEAQDAFFLFCRRLYRSDEWQSVELGLVNEQAKHLVVHVDGVRDAKYPRKRCRLSFTDITEVKRSEAALRASQARLAAGTELAGLGYYEIDYGERAGFFDDRFHEICGVPAGQQHSLQSLEFWMDHLHRDDRQHVLDERQKLHEGRLDRLSMEYRYVHPAQGQKWIHHLARVAGRSATGRAVRTYGVVRDITERKRLLERLQAAAEEWQATFDSINDMVMILDPQYRIVRVNAATVRFLGLPMEKIVGSACYALMHGTACAIEGCPCQKALQTQQREGVEIFHEGSGKWLWLSTDPIRDAAGNVIGMVHVGRDVTEGKQAEAEVLRQRAELAHVARVSTMGELAASVAHELNQPLGAILANAEAAELFLQQEPPALDDLRAILADIRADDERAGEVIHRMRALLRKRELEREPLQINLLVEGVFRLVSGDAALRQTAIAAELSPYVPPIEGDRIHLQQVLLNLIMNALEAMAKQPREKRRLIVRTSRANDGGVEVSVADSGPGIEPVNLTRLFEPFFTTKESGIGMGLPIARKIVEAHHGRIWAENHPAGGAIFRFTLPEGREGGSDE